MKIVVIGGSGRIGSRLIKKLSEQGQQAVDASPSSGVDTLTGDGLLDALNGADAVVDVTDSPSFDTDQVMTFFTTSTRNILAAEVGVGITHHVVLSAVGTDRLVESGYFRAKIAQEDLIKRSSIPYSIVHATQLFEFMKSIAEMSSDGYAVRVPPVLIQPMAAEDVAGAVWRVAMGRPLNGIVEVAGPDQFRFDELIRRFLHAIDDPREVITDSSAPFSDAHPRWSTLVPGHDAALATTTFDDWLAHVPSLHRNRARV